MLNKIWISLVLNIVSLLIISNFIVVFSMMKINVGFFSWKLFKKKYDVFILNNIFIFWYNEIK